MTRSDDAPLARRKYDSSERMEEGYAERRPSHRETDQGFRPSLIGEQSHGDHRTNLPSSYGVNEASKEPQADASVRRSREERSDAAKRGWETRRSKDAFK